MSIPIDLFGKIVSYFQQPKETITYQIFRIYNANRICLQLLIDNGSLCKKTIVFIIEIINNSVRVALRGNETSSIMKKIIAKDDPHKLTIYEDGGIINVGTSGHMQKIIFVEDLHPLCELVEVIRCLCEKGEYSEETLRKEAKKIQSIKITC